MPGNPVKLSGAAPTEWTAPPTLGRDTDRVLREIMGYEDAKVAALRAAGAVA